MMSHRRTTVALFGLLLAGTMYSQTASDACSYAAANKYPVGTSCAFSTFNKPNSYLNNYDPGTCNADGFGDAFGWFQATGSITTITFDPAASGPDPILHVLSGPCGGPYVEVGCVDDGLSGDNETLTIPTTPLANYLFRIERYDSNAAMNGSICIYTPPPPPPACGTTVYDPGGAGSNYANNVTYTATYCPATAGQQVTLTFTSFNTENGIDVIALYDGPSTASPLIGEWSGTNTPGVITSTNASGCITLHFESDASITRSGWAIDITCGTPPPPLYVCGTTIYDSGGAAGNYSNNQNTVTTYCPTTAGHMVSLNFSSFSVTSPDLVTIYDGASINSPVLGSFVGTGLPGTVTATNPGGCLTLLFFSNASTVSTGWAAAVTCAPPPPPPAGDCVYALNLNDSGGNGWGSSSVGVSINGAAATYYTVTGTSRQILIGVYIGQLVSLEYNASGPNQGQNSFSLSIQGQTTICSAGPSPTAGLQCVHTVDCIPPPNPPTDCHGAFSVCSGQAFNNNSDNSGNVADLNSSNQGCLSSGERQGTWYFFSPTTTGTIGFTIAPTVPTDYDFAVWGPYTNATCPPAGAPLRCSYAAPMGDTGCGNGAVDLSEGASGDRWVQNITVGASDVGQVFILYVDNFSSNGQSFNLSWQLSSSNSLDCSVLPLRWLAFEASPVGEQVALHWSTSDEFNCRHFNIERSADGYDFHAIGMLPSAGQNGGMTDYSFLDEAPHRGVNYYRIGQVDMSGDLEWSVVRSVLMTKETSRILAVPNPGRDLINVHLPPVAQGAILEMLDITGRVIEHRGVLAARMVLSTENMPDGIYLLRLLLPDGATLATERWVKE